MTQQEIIRMAREAELYSYLWGGDINQQSLEALERFAALVAAHEREACAKVCEELSERYLERCKNFFDERCASAEVAATECAAAIRARSDKE